MTLTQDSYTDKLELSRHNEPYGSWRYYFEGLIDDVRIYNRALSESEIQALFNEGK